MNKFYYDCLCRILRTICESWALILANVVFLGYGAYQLSTDKDIDILSILVPALLILLITRFIYLFSRPVTAAIEKGFLDPLFRYSYGFMFLALLLSIGPFVIRYGEKDFHQYQRPIGLVLGCSVDKDVAKDLQCFPAANSGSTEAPSDGKNLLNSAVDDLISSRVKVEQEREKINVEKTADSTGQPLNEVESALEKAERETYEMNNKVKGLSNANLQWLLNIGGSTVCHKYGLAFCEITGGLVVPLYFIVLALLGGAISLTRRVPEYQKRSESSYQAIATVKEPFMTYGQVRETLAFQIIQFISAPLIAIVAYQLIDPANVASAVGLGFIAGFSSEAILMMIRQLTNKMTPEKTDTPSLTGSVTGQVTESGGAGQGIKDASVTLVGYTSSIKTDETGHFLLKNTPAGEMVVEVTHKDSSNKESSKLLKVSIEQGITTQCPTITFP